MNDQSRYRLKPIGPCLWQILEPNSDRPMCGHDWRGKPENKPLVLDNPDTARAICARMNRRLELSSGGFDNGAE